MRLWRFDVIGFVCVFFFVDVVEFYPFWPLTEVRKKPEVLGLFGLLVYSIIFFSIFWVYGYGVSSQE